MTRDAIQALIQQWREKAERHRKHGDCYRVGQGWGLAECADELEALLTAEARVEPHASPERCGWCKKAPPPPTVLSDDESTSICGPCAEQIAKWLAIKIPRAVPVDPSPSLKE